MPSISRGASFSRFRFFLVAAVLVLVICQVAVRPASGESALVRAAIASAPVFATPTPTLTIECPTSPKNEMSVGETLTLTVDGVNAAGAAAAPSGLNWTSSAPAAASVVSASGVISAKQAGSTDISVSGTVGAPPVVNSSPCHIVVRSAQLKFQISPPVIQPTGGKLPALIAI